MFLDAVAMNNIPGCVSLRRKRNGKLSTDSNDQVILYIYQDVTYTIQNKATRRTVVTDIINSYIIVAYAFIILAELPASPGKTFLYFVYFFGVARN